MGNDIENMHLDGGCLCLDFINTVHSRTEMPMTDYLFSYDDIIRWTKRTGILSKKEQKNLSDYVIAHQDKAGKVFKKIIKVREELFAVFWPITNNQKPPAEVLQRFNRDMSSAFSHMRLIPFKDKMQIVWNEDHNPLLLPLWMVLKSAYDVLTEEPQNRIKACPSCRWLFLDTTKNNKRRWCNSLTCGSIDKATRYYYRKKEENKAIK